MRIHAAELKYGKVGDIYRVSRQKQGLDINGQGTGLEYIDTKGNWHHTSTLKPRNSNFNQKAAKDTHISVPKY